MKEDEKKKKNPPHLIIRNTVIHKNISEEIKEISLQNGLGNVARLHNMLIGVIVLHQCTIGELLNEKLTCFSHQLWNFTTNHLLNYHIVSSSYIIKG